ncbi:MAG: hypothetical protein ABIN56_01995 [Dokdonella sp.]
MIGGVNAEASSVNALAGIAGRDSGKSSVWPRSARGPAVKGRVEGKVAPAISGSGDATPPEGLNDVTVGAECDFCAVGTTFTGR